MYNTAHFSRMPKSSLPGTRMKKPQIVAGTSKHGECIPLFCNMVMPGTIDSNLMNGVIWMSNPIAPILSQIKASINVFFVPMRLVWEHTKEFFGENTSSSGPQQIHYKIPATPDFHKYSNVTPVVGSVSHYLGKPLKHQTGTAVNTTRVSCLKERAYWLVISEFYRHQQIQNPVILQKNDSFGIGTLNGNALTFASMPWICNKDFDYFTTATINPNYGGEVLLPLGSLAPVIFDQNSDLIAGTSWTTEKVANDKNVYTFGQDSDGQGTSARLYADLSAATAAKIDDLYTAMAAQAWYHNANYGSRYFECLEIHYGVSNPDLVLDRPEHVSEFKFDIAIQEVVSTAGATSDAQTKLGQPGGVSRTPIRKRLYNHSFGEWGFVIGIMNTYHQRYYSAGVQREDLYSELFDLYFPEFACRGDDAIYDSEIWFDILDNTNGVFGYQEAYADRRYYQARTTGQLDPYAGSSALGRWVLAEAVSTKPTFGSIFISEDRDAIKDALVSGSAGPDYIWQFNFEHTEILPMPAYSKPGIPSFGRGIV